MEGGANISESIDELRKKVALSCRILAMMGLVKEITGHVSFRISEKEMLMRCRGDDEYGLAYTEETAVRRMDFNGQGPEITPNYQTALELPIHGEIYRNRPDVNCVIHAHPPASLVCGISDLEIRPIIGAYDPTAMSLTLGGVPIYPRSVLIRNQELANSLISVMGANDVCLMKGHGITVTGKSIEEATVRAIKFESLAQITLQVAQLGRTAPDIPWMDIEDFVRTSKGGSMLSRGVEWVWRHYVKLLEEKEGNTNGTN